MQGDELKKLGSRISEIRKHKKLTMSAVCYKVGIEPSTLGRIERGEVDPKYTTLCKIAKSFNIKISDLVNQ